MKTRILALLVLLGAPLLHAGSPTQILLDYDIDSTTETFPHYCTYPGPYDVTTCPGQGKASLSNATTSGSSTTTVTSATASAGAFLGIAAGDMVIFGTVTGPEVRRVTAAASVDSITIDNNITIPTAGVGFRWWHLNVAATAEDGWWAFPPSGTGTLVISLGQIDATSVDYSVQCRHKNFDRASLPVYVAGTAATPISLTAATAQRVTFTDERYDQCRVGVKVTSDDGADTTTHAEKVSVTFELSAVH